MNSGRPAFPSTLKFVNIFDFFACTVSEYFQTISFPKGVNARVANLKCCNPKGIPIMEMQNRIPKPMCDKQIQNPPKTIQIIFMITDKHPEAEGAECTSLPNGHKASPASLRVWIPNGIPMIVMIKARLHTRYSMAIKMPPKTSQIKFPMNFI